MTRHQLVFFLFLVKDYKSGCRKDGDSKDHSTTEAPSLGLDDSPNKTTVDRRMVDASILLAITTTATTITALLFLWWSSHRSVDRTASSLTTTTLLIGGAEFLGGKKRKGRIHDPQAEAAVVLRADDKPNDSNGAWDRFADRLAYSNDTVASVARQLQRCINQVLYDDAE